MDPRQQSLFPQDLPPWEIDAGQECSAASVVFSEAPYGPFHYRIPDRLADQVQPGMRVRVPLGKSNREIIGYCIAVEIINHPVQLLKDVIETVDAAPLCTANLLKLIHWMARYYIVPIGQIFEAVIPAGVRASAGMRMRVTLLPSAQATNASAIECLSSKQRIVMEQLIGAGEPLTVEQLRKLANCSDGPIQALRSRGLIESREEQVMERVSNSITTATKVQAPALSGDQRQALAIVNEALDSGQHETVLLHGITGSGKTEVYMQAIEKTLSFGRQAIVLVPEISLTPQTRSQFQDRFRSVAVLHSHMTDAERHFHWRRILMGEVNVVIGPRSAVFAPLPHLGLIVLDEEHESSFKQDTIPRYHARDVALHRAFLEQIPLVLGSATPCLETWNRATQGQYRLARMPRRIHNRPMPLVSIIDMRTQRLDSEKGSISQPLFKEVQQTLANNGQTILLLNRRGFATSIQCPGCGHVVSCPDCDLPLTHHRDGSKCVCHYCDYTIPTPPCCPQCRFINIHFGGTGTQKLEMEVKSRFPDVAIARMDSDTMRRPGSHERVLSEFRAGKLQILLGTQMIAKGLDFPNVLLVGVINADSALHFPDFRASERTFQLITQVAGRTGRGDRPGLVLVQTFSPEHPAIQAAAKHDFHLFAAAELEHRKKYKYPPFGSLARMIIRGEDEKATEELANSIVRLMARTRDLLACECRILGPAPPPIARLRGKYRFHILISTSEPAPLNQLLTRVDSELKNPDGIQYVIDIDPLDML